MTNSKDMIVAADPKDRVYVTVRYQPTKGQRRRARSVTRTIHGTSDVQAVMDKVVNAFNGGAS